MTLVLSVLEQGMIYAIMALADHFQRYRGYQLNLLIPKKSGTPDGVRSFFFIIIYFNVRNRFAFLSAGRSAM